MDVQSRGAEKIGIGGDPCRREASSRLKKFRLFRSSNWILCFSALPAVKVLAGSLDTLSSGRRG
jgi:hypothetical protein